MRNGTARGEEALDQLYVVTHPEPVVLDVQAFDHETTPEGAIALAYFHRGNLLARGVVSPDAVDAIRGLLRRPVSLALAATEDEQGNIDARVCLVLPVDQARAERDGDESADEPWRESVPQPPPGIDSYTDGAEPADDGRPRLALLPIGNVIRGVGHRNHPDVPSDAREMLDNLLAGKAQDAVSRAIDDLLDSL